MRELFPSGMPSSCEVGLTPVTIRRRGVADEVVADEVAEEYPLTVCCQRQRVATLMCTPTHLEELVLGFLYAEGLIVSARDVADVQVEMGPGGGQALVSLETEAAARLPAAASGGKVVWTGCGHGPASRGEVPVLPGRIAGGLQVTATEIQDMMEVVMRAPLHRASGGTHAAALAHRGNILCLREDVGRHNAVDKTIGWWLRQGSTEGGKAIVLTTGRLSADMVLKAIRLGAPLVVSRAAPTAQGIRLAFRAGLTLVGFARAGRMNVYTSPERIIGG